MIYTLQKSAVIVVAAAGAEVLNKLFDLSSIQNMGDVASIELRVATNGTAPGAGRELNVKAAFTSDDTATPTELSTAQIEQVCAIQNTANVRRFYLLPLLYQGARYLRVWADLNGLAAGATLTVEIFVNTKR